MNRKRKGKPILQVLLIAALALNTTLSFVVLAKRNRMAEPTEKRESAPLPAVITLQGATVDGNTQTIPPVSRPDAVNAKRVQATVKKNAPQKVEKLARDKDEIAFLPSPVLYRLARDTSLVTRSTGASILIPKGTLVRVAGMTLDDKALVVSHKGNPDGLIARTNLEAIPVEEALPNSSAPLQKATVNAPTRAGQNLGPFRLSGGPHGGSIGLGTVQIYISQNGQISGSLSR